VIYTLKDKIFEKIDIEVVVEERERKLEEEKQAKRRAEEETKRQQLNKVPMKNTKDLSKDIKGRIEKDKKQGFWDRFKSDKDKDKKSPTPG
jgi:uncharacterized protein YpmB